MIRYATRYVFLVLLLALMLQACAVGKQLATTSAEPAELKGTYTLLLYGCHYPEDIKNLAILVDEGSRYPVEIYDLPTSFRVEKGSARTAGAARKPIPLLAAASGACPQTQLRKITDDAGGTIGYEVRPLYFSLEFRNARCPARFLLPAERNRQKPISGWSPRWRRYWNPPGTITISPLINETSIVITDSHSTGLRLAANASF